MFVSSSDPNESSALFRIVTPGTQAGKIFNVFEEKQNFGVVSDKLLDFENITSEQHRNQNFWFGEFPEN